jgi:hypothetical protein
MVGQEATHKAKLKPAIVALCKTADTPDCLDKQLFDIIPLLLRTCLKKQKSHKQTARINVVTPTVRQAKADKQKQKQPTKSSRPNNVTFVNSSFDQQLRPSHRAPLQCRSTNSNPFLDSGMDSHLCDGVSLNLHQRLLTFALAQF